MDSITPSVTPESDNSSLVQDDNANHSNPNPPVEETNVEEEGYVEEMTSDDDASIGDDGDDDDASICDDGDDDASNGDDGDDDDASNGEDLNERKVLPEELLKNVMHLSCESTAEGGSCDVFLVGTAHVSQDSCKEVRDVIAYLKPEVVFLELCPSRIGLLTPQSVKVPTMGQMIDTWKKNPNQNAFGILYSWFLAKVATKLEVLPGAEFRVAYDEAIKYGGKVILGDRPVKITLRRTWGKMPLWHKTKMLYHLCFVGLFLPSPEEINKMLKEMDDTDMVTIMIQELSKHFPSLLETLVHERDQFMSFMLQEVASEHSSVVAVVGRGHLHGIKKNWKQPIELNELLQIPQENKTVSVLKIIASLGVAVAGVAILSGIFLSYKK